MEKLAASLLAALASVLMFLLLRREGNPWALPLALAFAFGTNTWMISSQALWQHGPGSCWSRSALLLARAARVAVARRGARLRLRPDRGEPSAGRADRRRARCSRGLADKRDVKWLLAGAALPLAALLYLQPRLHRQLVGGYAGCEGRARALLPPRPAGAGRDAGEPGRGACSSSRRSWSSCSWV